MPVSSTLSSLISFGLILCLGLLLVDVSHQVSLFIIDHPQSNAGLLILVHSKVVIFIVYSSLQCMGMLGSIKFQKRAQILDKLNTL